MYISDELRAAPTDWLKQTIKLNDQLQVRVGGKQCTLHSLEKTSANQFSDVLYCAGVDANMI